MKKENMIQIVIKLGDKPQAYSKKVSRFNLPEVTEILKQINNLLDDLQEIE